jgi:DNA primase
MKEDSDPLRLILGKVQHRRSGEGYSFKCPAHTDTRNSGYLKADAKGNVILKCFAGCTRKAICEALGVTQADLYVQEASSYLSNQTVARYQYYDEDGKLLYEHRRLVDSDGRKTFLYCRTGGTGSILWTLYGGWFELKGKTWKRIEGANDPYIKPAAVARWFDESRRVLYRLGVLVKAAPGSIVLYCEGEKDVENAEALGFVATTAGGAADWRMEFADYLQGFDLVIIPDNDNAGRLCAAKVARDCYGKTARIRILELPGLEKGGDLSDWIQAGGTSEKLLTLIAATERFEGNLTEDFRRRNKDPKMPLWEDSSGQNTRLKETGDRQLSDSQSLFLKEESGIDLSETRDDELLVSSDPRRENYLRQLAGNTATIIEACLMILRLLGFEKNHARLLNALIAIGGDRLRPFQVWQASIRERYGAIGHEVSKEAIQRDIKQLCDEQTVLGVTIISYSPGSEDSAKGQPFPCLFQNRLLRYALEAINIAMDARNDFETARLALKAACQMVVKSIPRTKTVKPQK